jgi:hypothetical protein
MANFFLTEILAYNVLSEQYTVSQIQKIMQEISKWQPLAYLFIPLVIIFRVLYTSFCLYAGALLQEYRWGFKKIYNISLKAEIVFLLSQAGNFYYYLFKKDTLTIDEVNTNFLSLLKFAGREDTPSWLVSAYNAVNVFEIVYMLLLAFFLHLVFKYSFLKSAFFVLLTYGIGTYLYIALMTFLYLNYL